MSLKLQLDGEAWLAVLADLAGALGKEGSPIRLCLIGSAACLFGGMDGRTSADLDIWKPASDYDRLELENLIAAKLIRAEPKDLGDIRFLLSRHRPDLQRVRGIIAEFETRARERASENLVYLDVLET
jgi:hypothetical protein